MSEGGSSFHLTNNLCYITQKSQLQTQTVGMGDEKREIDSKT